MNSRQILIDYYKYKDNEYLINNIDNIINFILLIDDFKYKSLTEIINKYKYWFSPKLICFTITLLYNKKLLNIVIFNNTCIYY